MARRILNHIISGVCFILISITVISGIVAVLTCRIDIALLGLALVITWSMAENLKK